MLNDVALLYSSSPAFFAGSIFLIGLIVGSFLNVVIYRLPIILEREWRSQAADVLSAGTALTAEPALAPFSFQRRDVQSHDVQIDISYCGVCHSDIHQARNEWGGSIYPMVPGHEIVGRVTAVGSAVKKFKEGDIAAVGCMVNSCRKCANCLAGAIN